MKLLFSKLQYHHATMKGLRTSAATLLQSKQREVSNVMTLLNGYMMHANGNRTDMEDCRRTLNSVEEEISAHEDELNRVRISVNLNMFKVVNSGNPMFKGSQLDAFCQ